MDRNSPLDQGGNHKEEEEGGGVRKEDTDLDFEVKTEPAGRGVELRVPISIISLNLVLLLLR